MLIFHKTTHNVRAADAGVVTRWNITIYIFRLIVTNSQSLIAHADVT